MSYSIDVNILVYASDKTSKHQPSVVKFLQERINDPELFCLSWITLMSYQRIITHSGIFSKPLTPHEAWKNVEDLLRLPQVRVISEEEDFSDYYLQVTAELHARGNLVPNAHLAAILRQHGVNKIYSADSDFQKIQISQSD